MLCRLELLISLYPVMFTLFELIPLPSDADTASLKDDCTSGSVKSEATTPESVCWTSKCTGTAAVGDSVGKDVGDTVGKSVGRMVGAGDGLPGAVVGRSVGSTVGAAVDGWEVGATVGE